MSETILVTGGTGYVAGWCIVELLKRGYRVRATLRRAAAEHGVRAAIASQVDAGERLSFVLADLDRDAGWDAAMAGCAGVLHVASPLGAAGAQDLLTPARDGTLRVLAAATRAGVHRIVMTSAAAAARVERDGAWHSDEALWPAPMPTDPYRLSKIAAERAAWDFMAARGATERLTTVLPAAVFGPLLPGQPQGSVQVIQRLLDGRPPAVPRLGFAVVDVRDLARLHVDALASPAAAGQRFIAAGDYLWLGDMAALLRSRLGGRATRVPRRTMPDWVFRLLALALPPLRMLTADLGRVSHPSADKARRLLAFAPRPAAETVLDCAHSLLAAR